ncbi:uncharacterized protein A4U43_C05F9760 [Asparagus officinalis]|uniref:Uncharacterized protein n=1 Tax=Asparagus officinalis TaxID=4686 RepID=A0A5P1EQK0_ASPOF|nr:uncharacterized protein A4U43_C05F9760 [Asparagus officinalis]
MVPMELHVKTRVGTSTRLKKHLYPNLAPKEAEGAHANMAEIAARLSWSSAATVQAKREVEVEVKIRERNDAYERARSDRLDTQSLRNKLEEQIAHETLRQESTRASLKVEQ